MILILFLAINLLVHIVHASTDSIQLTHDSFPPLLNSELDYFTHVNSLAASAPRTVIDLENHPNRTYSNEHNVGSLDCPVGLAEYEIFADPNNLSKIWKNVGGTRPWKPIIDAVLGRCATPDWSIGDETAFAQLYKGNLYSKNGCLGVLNSIAFDVRAFSEYPYCFGEIQLWVGDQTPTGWKKAWEFHGGFAMGSTGWRHVTISFPPGFNQLVFHVRSAQIENCKNFAPTYLDNIMTYTEFKCPCSS